MIVEKIMSPKVVSVHLDHDLYQVKNLFETYRFHHLLVIEGRRLRGVITDRDLLKAISPYVGTPAETSHDSLTMEKRAHQIMTRHPVTVTRKASLIDILEKFNHHRVSCLPVVDDEQCPLGIITWRDILRAIEVTTRKRLGN